MALTFLPTVLGNSSPTFDHFRNEWWYIPRIKTTQISTKQHFLPCLRPCLSERQDLTVNLGKDNNLVISATRNRNSSDDMIERLFFIFSRHASVQAPALTSDSKISTMITASALPLSALGGEEQIISQYRNTLPRPLGVLACWLGTLGLFPGHETSLVLTTHRLAVSVTSYNWNGSIKKTTQVLFG